MWPGKISDLIQNQKFGIYGCERIWVNKKISSPNCRRMAAFWSEFFNGVIEFTLLAGLLLYSAVPIFLIETIYGETDSSRFGRARQTRFCASGLQCAAGRTQWRNGHHR